MLSSTAPSRVLNRRKQQAETGNRREPGQNQVSNSETTAKIDCESK